MPARLTRRLRQEIGLDPPRDAGGGMVRNAIGAPESSSVYVGIDVSNLPSSSRESPCPSKCDETSAQCLAQIHNQIIYVSATPGPYEHEQTDTVIQQIIRPTGLLDPVIEVRPIMGQIDDLVGEINERVEKDQRVFVTTLTKKMAEDLTDYFKELGIKVKYLHSDIKKYTNHSTTK